MLPRHKLLYTYISYQCFPKPDICKNSTKIIIFGINYTILRMMTQHFVSNLHLINQKKEEGTLYDG